MHTAKCHLQYAVREKGIEYKAKRKILKFHSSFWSGFKRASDYLDEGALTLKICQKHIKVVDRSRFGWGTVNHYKSDPLADDEDDTSIDLSRKQTRLRGI